MKISKEDLKKKISEKVTDEDVSIELLEDIEDSMIENAESNAENEAKIAELEARVQELETKNAEIKAKYKERFLSGAKENSDDEEDSEERKIIDIKEI